MIGKTWKTWTRKEDRRLEELRLAGLTSAQIAKRLDRTEPSVKCRLQQLRLLKPFEGRRVWLEAFADPHTIAELARRFGVTRHAVKQAKRRLRRLGFDVPAARKE